ncbi:alpha/beta hydrolase [Deinococcus sonorensis]|uniref:Alpha/beta hydrolase n=2 Tax=Deinococcus sonorensis TaxID=309891 RepID=A0AAU7U8G8_9DEIO
MSRLPASYSHVRRINGLLTHARVYPGPPGRPGVVIVPGLGCACWMYRRLARALQEHLTVWVYDHPGMGASQGHPCRIEQLTDHLADWLLATGQAGRPLLGHSLGGEVAIDLAARFPALTPALVLYAPTGIPENPSVAAQLARLALDLPRERPQLWLAAALAYLRTGTPRMWCLAQDQERHQTGPLIPQVRCPVLVLDGSRDVVIRAWTLEILCEHLPDAEGWQVVGGTHALMDSRPAELARLTVEFLNRRLPLR